MAVSSGRGSTSRIPSESWAAFCAALPGRFLFPPQIPLATAAFQRILDALKNGLIPTEKSKPNPLANLWFMRAAHLYASAGGDPLFFSTHLLPLCKKIIQDFISPSGLGGVLMDDGGLIIPPAYHTPSASPALVLHPGLRINALWYSGLETTGVALKSAGDRSGDHFERLAGRFRRSFAKSYWCDPHACVCIPDEKSLDSHPADSPSLSPDQLLLTILPASPIPRTKQRQILHAVRAKSLGELGIVFNHPAHGPVESILHRAWLVTGLLSSADSRNSALPEATEIAAPLLSLLAASPDGLPALYKSGQPLEPHPDPLTTAEVHTALALLRSN